MIKDILNYLKIRLILLYINGLFYKLKIAKIIQMVFAFRCIMC
jgi:K+-transporting ATPase c subunit